MSSSTDLFFMIFKMTKCGVAEIFRRNAVPEESVDLMRFSRCNLCAVFFAVIIKRKNVTIQKLNTKSLRN